MKGFFARHRRKLACLAALVALPLALHLGIGLAARLTPPPVHVPTGVVTTDHSGLRRFGAAYVKRRGRLLEVGLEGSPAEIGYAHARLLYPEMVHNEGVLLELFQNTVTVGAARVLLLDLAQLRFRTVDRGMSPDRLQEVAASALGFQPDPYVSWFPTYQRFVYLNALYDMSLSFEHSPLIGCTSFVLNGAGTRAGEALLARAFDFEAHPVFDDQKAVFFVRETGRIPFASVAWPGLVGVVSGMNVEGVSVVVHGGRAGDVDTEGEPVVHALRRVLGSARTTREALARLRERGPMVSHILVFNDASGDGVVVERVPSQPDHHYRLAPRDVVTNHFKGPAADDPKNVRVRQTTSTLPRAQRGEQIVRQLAPGATARDAVGLLRERRGPNGAALPLGDRRAIDALIATHGVVMNGTTRTLWVSEAPHLLGRFVAYDVRKKLAQDYDPAADQGELPTIPADPLLESEAYRRYREGLPSGPQAVPLGQ